MSQHDDDSTDSTVVIKDLKAALSASEKEAQSKPAAFLGQGGVLNGAIFDLKDAVTTFGRVPENTYQFDFEGISRNHLKLHVKDDGVIIEDAGSRNGTYINDKKLESPEVLKKGDIVKLGSLSLKYIPKGDPERLIYDKLNLEANSDKHTGCFNKGYFNNALENEVKKSKATGSPLSLIITDLDHFKKLNDNFGHDAGDFVLKEFAMLLRKNGIRDNDIFARYGGEEFCIILPKTNLKQAFEIAERLRKLIETHEFMYEGKRLPVATSVGVADYRQGVNTATDLFKRADSAVYKSKQGGRNQVNFFRE